KRRPCLNRGGRISAHLSRTAGLAVFSEHQGTARLGHSGHPLSLLGSSSRPGAPGRDDDPTRPYSRRAGIDDPRGRHAFRDGSASALNIPRNRLTFFRAPQYRMMSPTASACSHRKEAAKNLRLVSTAEAIGLSFYVPKCPSLSH